METVQVVLSVLAVLALVWGILVYNRFVALRNNVEAAWSNIDVLLRQRYEEVPKLVETCRIYMRFERDTLEKITELRNAGEHCRRQGDVSTLGTVESELGSRLGGLIVRAEAYPELSSSDQFQRLLARISYLQDSISDRREFYNEAAKIKNTRRDQFPDVIIARAFGFGYSPLFEAAPEQRETPDIRALFEQ